MIGAFTPSQMGSCANKGIVCHRSSETGELWCPRLRRWLGGCPKDAGGDERDERDEQEDEINDEWFGEEDNRR